MLPSAWTATAHTIVRSDDGFLPLDGYGVLGDGRSVLLSGADGSIDWWAVPNIDSPPMFDRLLDTAGGRFLVAPVEPFTVERRYRNGSNVLETLFRTASGQARLVESLNSGSAGRLPWTELARRVEGVEGSVRFAVDLRFSRRLEEANSYVVPTGGRLVFHLGSVLGLFLADDGVAIERHDDEGVGGTLTVRAGERRTVAIVAGDDEPLFVPAVANIDRRIDLSDQEWRQWSDRIVAEPARRATVLRSALTLKLLLFSPTGAIAAAATTSLPERIGGTKNYDYRYAWVRDAGYTIRAFLRLGAHAEAKSALTWLLDRLDDGEPRVAYRLDGRPVPPARELAMPGWQGTGPVVSGNIATEQLQLGLYGDIFETASAFVRSGILDSHSMATLGRLADRCADSWRLKDSGIWELTEPQHYTMSKISAWQTLARAVEMADAGFLPVTCSPRWSRERDRIAAWIAEHCWSQERGAYVLHPGSDRLDAAIALAVHFGFAGADDTSEERLRATLDAIDRDLGAGPFHYRYGGADEEEGCFLACSFWMVEARAKLGDRDRAARDFDALVAALDRGVGVLPEMIDPETGTLLGNLPQGLTHLALVNAAASLSHDS